ncbi:MAG: hypothetical protein HOQ11_05820 [Gemmatimonadaceae bacterium]|nr:hypothetical protein [Gemmatimonadaceae bacterium]NUQ93656.1 hypothetical protein [Gemmatimonadaceae bacterium]NUR18406.1 hypothetical protein [Gemmatimonadaceae bacterium]NUS96904.1 hypothetical protein [Gemmatimonadaceae bacterium]
MTETYHPRATPAQPLTPDSGASLQFSTIWLITVVKRHLRTLILAPIGIATLAVLYVLLVGRTYQADSSFTPESSSGALQRMAGLAAQFGVAIGGGNTGESVDFYAELVRSRSILEDVVNARYVYHPKGLFAGSDSIVGSLMDVYRSGGNTPEQRLNGAIRTLNANLAVRANPRSSIVRVSVVAPTAELAESINANLLKAVSDFNVAKRQTRAASEREFVAERLRLAREELQSSEAALENFLQGNRRYQDAPQLMVQYGRLQRQVELRQQVANTLAQAFEQSRIEEVRNTPVITVVERPEGAARPARTLRQAALLGGLLGGILTLATVLGFEFLRAQGVIDPHGRGGPFSRLRALFSSRRNAPAR